jgi:hypothetical protein
MRQFQAPLEARGPGGAWIFVTIPFDVADAFGSRGRIPVVGTINGFAFRSSLLAVGDGTHRMAVSKPMRAGAQADAGDLVTVTIARDDEQRSVAVPDELLRALANAPEAAATFERFAYSHRKAYVDWIASAKQPETRERRAAKAVTMLASGKKLR